MNTHTILLSCLAMVFFINHGILKCDGAQCGPNTLLCPCNGPLSNKQFAMNIKYCLSKKNTCEPCDQITDTVKCKIYKNYCNQGNNNSNVTLHKFSTISSDYSGVPCKCLNSGTCISNSKKACICPEKFEGVLCELEKQKEAHSPAIFCEIPESPVAGYIAYESELIVPGEHIQYMCNQGYELYGNVTHYCLDSGKFDGIAPTCEKICRIPDMSYMRLDYVLNPNHQNKTDYVNQFGNVMITTIQFYCQDHFSMVGPSMIHCSNGIWDNKPPSCVWNGSACKVPVRQSDLLIQEPAMKASRIIPGSALHYKCKNGTIMIGTANIVCSYNGTWVPDPPSCWQAKPNAIIDSGKSSCSAPKLLDNGYSQLQIDLNGAVPGIKNDYSIVPVQTQVLYSCKDGYRLSTSEATRMCLPNGQWSGKDPKCIPECGKPNSPIQAYMLNGTAITINRWPWHVGLYNYDTYIVFCGGSVLNEKWVLTAAHCVTNKGDGGIIQQVNHETYGVFFGHSTSQVNVSSRVSFVKRKVWSVIHHQDFNANTLDSDIALIMLEIPLTFSNEIHPVCLPTIKSTITDITNSVGFVAGWGETEPNITKMSPDLRYIQVKIVTNAVCRSSNVDINGFHPHITENMFCAKGVRNGSGACHGDSGGSLCVKIKSGENEVFQIEGIVGFGGSTCGVKGQYDGFTRVRNFVNWIQYNMKQQPE